MRTWQPLQLAHPILSLMTGACVILALVALTLAATSAPATAQSTPAKFAVSPDEVVISGTVVGVGDGLIGIQEAGSSAPVAFPVASEAAFSRGGAPVALTDLRRNDPIHLTVDRATGTVLQVVAEPGPRFMFQPSDSTAAVAALGFLVAAAVLVARLRPPAATTGGATTRRVDPARRPRLPALALHPYSRTRQPEYQA
jgi:hypothetical protein